jgi:hypothetical protein
MWLSRGTIKKETAIFLRQGPNDEQSQEQENSDATSHISSLSKTLRIISWVCVRDVSVIASIVDQSNLTKCLPSVIGVVEDRETQRNNGCCANACNTPIETGVSCTD